MTTMTMNHIGIIGMAHVRTVGCRVHDQRRRLRSDRPDISIDWMTDWSYLIDQNGFVFLLFICLYLFFGRNMVSTAPYRMCMYVCNIPTAQLYNSCFCCYFLNPMIYHSGQLDLFDEYFLFARAPKQLRMENRYHHSELFQSQKKIIKSFSETKGKKRRKNRNKTKMLDRCHH